MSVTPTPTPTVTPTISLTPTPTPAMCMHILIYAVNTGSVITWNYTDCSGQSHTVSMTYTGNGQDAQDTGLCALSGTISNVSSSDGTGQATAGSPCT
jgi:hypothetical protein